jgi:CRISPR-associated protein Cas2
MFIVVSYDIVSDKRRRRVFKMMKNYGLRVQYSVFECLLSADQVKEMKGRVEPLLEPRQDSVRYYLLCEACQGRAAVQGNGAILREKATIFV